MSRLHGLRERLLGLLRGGERDRWLDEELRHHLELESARQRERGHDERTARRVALERLGDPAWIKEATRDARGHRPLEGNMQDLRWALRGLGKQPGFTLLALVTLALGIGATTVAFTVFDTVLLRPLPFQEPERLVLVRERTEEARVLPPSYPNFADWRERARGFASLASATFPASWTVGAGDEPVFVRAMGLSRGFLATLGVRPVVGREFTAEEQAPGGPQAVMVSHDLWTTQLGARRPLGTLRLGDAEVPIVGVLPPGFRFEYEAQLYYPHEQGPGTIRNAHAYLVVGRLAPGTTLAAARAEMTALSAALRAAHGGETQAVDADVTPLRDYLVGDHRGLLRVVLGAAALVLLIACTNLVSAQLARGLARQREVSVRSALGASRGRLLRLLLVESLVLAAGGALLGALLAAAGTRLVRAAGSGLLPRLDELTVDARVLGFCAAITALTAVVVGLYPALRLSAGDAGTVLRGGARGDLGRRSRAWPLLVGFEIATALVLLVGSTLLVRTMRNILSADVGFDPRGVVTATISSSGMELAELERVRAELAALPGVRGAAWANQPPLAWGNVSAPLLRPTDPPDAWPAMAGFRVVTPDYFAVLGQPLLEGRSFGDADRAGGAPVAIVTDGAARRLWPDAPAVGQRVRTNFLADQWLTVVGVVREASSWTMPRGEQHEIYVPLAQQLDGMRAAAGGQLVAMVRGGGDAAALVPAVRSRLRDVAPAVPARLGTMDERIASSAADRRFATAALAAFGLVALVLAGVGIYGVMAYTVVTRTHEVGVRLALGATPGGVMRHVLRGALAMGVGGVVVGAAAGLVATRWLESALYGVSRLDPATYALGAAVLLGIALLGAWVPARRSSRVDPVRAMRGS